MLRPILVLAALVAGAAAAPAQTGPDPAARPADPVREQIVGKLTGLRVTLEFNETPLEEAIDFLQQVSRLNILIDSTVTERHPKGSVKITMKVKDLPLGSALKLLLETRGLTLLYRDQVLLVVTEDRANKSTFLQVYDVRDLLMKINAFPGPEISLEPLKVGVGIPEAVEPPGELTEDFVLNAVKLNCGKESWDANPKVSAELHNGLLIVTQTQDVHRQIKALLQKLRENK
jgi:type II secretory pathway component GspD/PulD (secretin)